MTLTSPDAAIDTLLDQIMPRFHRREVHSTWIDAPVERVWTEVHAVALRDTVISGALLALRALPGQLLRGRILPPPKPLPFIETMLRGGFIILGEQPPTEIVAGIIAQFWKLRGAHPASIAGPDAFRDFATPGWAKAAINFRITPERHGARLTTETRIVATDPTARRSFTRYWSIIHAGSALIRLDLLRAVKRRAEQT